VALLNINLGHNFLQSALYGFSAAVGFSLVMVLFASIRERLVVSDTRTVSRQRHRVDYRWFNVVSLYGL
jgi:Na+-translocating ferredoxin:NAD+ oxidoreductase RnfA subunit